MAHIEIDIMSTETGETEAQEAHKKVKVAKKLSAVITPNYSVLNSTAALCNFWTCGHRTLCE